MALIDYDYELNNENEINDIINELPIELVREVIYNQIRNPEENTVDNLSSLIYKVETLMDEFKEDYESVSLLKTTFTSFLIAILQRISTTYQIGIDVNEDNFDELKELTQALYEMLVLRYTKNVTLYLYNSIIKNLDTLAETYEANTKKKDFSSLFGITGENEEAKKKAIIVYNLPIIFKTFYDMDGSSTDPVEFMQISGMDKLYYGDKIRTLIEDGKITGNFVPVYMDLLLDDYDEIKQDIFNDLRTKLILEIVDK